MFAMLMANMFLLPIFMQELLGFSAVQSGFALMPRVIVMMIAVPIVGRIYNMLSPRAFIAVGVLLFSLSSWMLSHLTLESGTSDIVVPLIIQGVAFACLFVPLTTVALSNIPRQKMADATGLNSLLRQIGGAIGLAIFATLIGHYASSRAAASMRTSPRRARSVAAACRCCSRASWRAAWTRSSAKTAALRAMTGSVMAQSTVLSFDRIFILAGGLFLLVLAAAVLPADAEAGEARLPLTCTWRCS